MMMEYCWIGDDDSQIIVINIIVVDDVKNIIYVVDVITNIDYINSSHSNNPYY